MAVKKLNPKRSKKSVKKKPKKVSKRSEKAVVIAQSTITLPTKKNKPDFNLNSYMTLMYGREKIGKTIAMSGFNDSLILATEPGIRGLEIFGRNIKGWNDIRRIVDLLEKTDQYGHVTFDTADVAYDMCLDCVCSEKNIEYPGESADGKADFGKSWRAVRMEFTDVVYRILRTGRGVGFTSHMKETVISSKSGGSYSMICPSMSKQALQVVAALVDLFFFVDYMTDIHGNTRRVIITQGDETIWAGHRKVNAKRLPLFLPLEEENTYQVIEAAFNGNHDGIDPSELKIGAKQGSDITQKFLMKTKSGTAKKGGVVKKKLKKKKKKRRIRR